MMFEHLFMFFFFAICVSSLENRLFRSSSHFFFFFDWVVFFFFFLVLSCWRLILCQINSVSVVSFANIIPYPVNCLFVLLRVSFVVQNILGLIKSHFFYFCFYCHYSRRLIGEDIAMVYIRVFSPCFSLIVLYYLVLYLGL